MAGSSSSVTDVDKGLKALLRRLGPQASLKVGIYGDAAAQRATDGHGASVGDIASAHEFGIVDPPRSFIRATVEEQADSIVAGIRKTAVAVVKGTSSARDGLNLIGFAIAGKMKSRIAGGIPPALSENYLPRKLAKYPGANVPLIASGQMRGSITHTVEDGRARDAEGRFTK